MAERFQNSFSSSFSNLGTGAGSSLMQLGNRFAQFGQQQIALANQQLDKAGKIIAQEEEQRGRAAFAEDQPFEEQKKEESFVGGVRSKAYNKGLQASYMASLSNDNRKTLNGLALEHQDDVLGFDQAVIAQRDALRQEVDPSVMPFVVEHFEELATSHRNKIQNSASVQVRKEQMQTELANLATISDDIQVYSRSGDTQIAAQAIQDYDLHLKAMVIAEHITPAEAKEKLKEQKMIAQGSTMLGNLERMAEIEGIEAAFASLDSLDDMPPKEFTQQEWDTWRTAAASRISQIANIKANAEAELTVEESREISNIKIMSRTGQGDLAEIVIRTDQLFEKGKITETERTSIITNAINGQKKSAQEALVFNQISSRLKGDQSVVVDDKDVSKYYDKFIAPTADPEQKIQFVRSMNMVPSALKSEVLNGLQSSDDALIVQSAQMMDQIDNIPGLPERTFSNNERAFANNVVSLLENMSPAEAVALGNQLVDPTNQARVEARTEELKEDQKGIGGINYREVVDDHFNPFFGGTQVDDVSGDQLAKEYRDIYESLFKSGMNKEGAKQKAFQLIERNWGVSGVTNKIMKYAPDKFYQVAGSVDYIKEQLLADVNESIATATPYKIEELFLQATEETARLNNGLPAYRVFAVRETGIELLHTQPWAPDIQAEIDRVGTLNREDLERLQEESR